MYCALTPNDFNFTQLVKNVSDFDIFDKYFLHITPGRVLSSSDKFII